MVAVLAMVVVVVVVLLVVVVNVFVARVRIRGTLGDIDPLNKVPL